ncbi:uncharacterized protein PV09_01980 [Verruconis gallopava]|uniref:Uncharacterized protein n=1 Tax=Verruconis gallopava TaxID=253628 RepID=A0A0D1Z2E3_9PEZI|nr:uncharacterized protein PV09_01980 [Verruconis gallopava]KIW07102.1 hypothetical protein PV09_01980 [Verruconis gallopava]
MHHGIQMLLQSANLVMAICEMDLKQAAGECWRGSMSLLDLLISACDTFVNGGDDPGGEHYIPRLVSWNENKDAMLAAKQPRQPRCRRNLGSTFYVLKPFDLPRQQGTRQERTCFHSYAASKDSVDHE